MLCNRRQKGGAAMTQYTTGELAKHCGVTVRTVQFYDSKGLLIPSDLTNGGRRLYSEDDLRRMHVICFLKDLGFSLKDISGLLESDDTEKVLKMLIEHQEEALRLSIDEDRKRLDRLHGLKQSMGSFNSITTDSIGVMADIVDNRKKLRFMRIKMVIVGIIMDIAWIPTLIYGIIAGVWWPFVIGVIVAVALGVWISLYYVRHTAYVCPDDHTIFQLPVRKMFFAKHTPSMRKLACPVCGFKGYCLEIYVPSGNPKNANGTLIWPAGGDAR
ncbi:MerR family transcriptional regulator [Eggerthellaceae bacterium zg-887]|nr:MerR family transcriptional regulator [Xiamenia xianingshaonis]